MSLLSRIIGKKPEVSSPDETNSLPRKLNIGCGYDKMPGYLNIDSDTACSPDLLVIDNDLYDLPRDYFDEVYAKDVLEHIPRAYMMNALFDWSALLRTGGEVYIQTSWVYGVIDIMRAGGTFEVIHNWKVCLFGNQAHPGDFHFNGFTEKTLRVYLHAVGLRDSGFNIADGWLISTRAKKVEDWNHLISMPQHDDFLIEAYRQLLGREPEVGLVEASSKTSAGSKERYQYLRAIVGSAERLYKLGRELENS
ncbi:methyltransferase [Ensifer sp. ENS11]|uniref:methyltransferase n=1 Tax=Ensifer sp. ENS11 TaxID=2769291 RepID=UPI001780A253|nr:methyltransferase [Ensifer sp. ENS11]MBD9491656.1 methyltransferase [Ensifer sp. ENS11]